MNAKQISKLHMYRTVEQVCTLNDAIVKTNTAFEQAFKKICNKISSINTTVATKVISTTGITIDKEAAKNTLCEAAFEIAGLVFAYANNAKSNMLQKMVDFSLSDLTKLKGDILIVTCQNIYNAANSNSTVLADYGVTATNLKTLQAAIDNYKSNLNKPQTAQSIKSTSTDNIKMFIKETDDILKNQLDKLILNFKATNPDFVKTYKNARNIIDPATKTTSLKKAVAEVE